MSEQKPNYTTRPPLEVKPEKMVNEERIINLAEAIMRYASHGISTEQHAWSIKMWADEIQRRADDIEFCCLDGDDNMFVAGDEIKAGDAVYVKSEGLPGVIHPVKIEITPYEERDHDQYMPDWSQAPEWAKWHYVHDNGRGIWSSRKTVRNWCRIMLSDLIMNAGNHGENSWRKRPEGK